VPPRACLRQPARHPQRNSAPGPRELDPRCTLYTTDGFCSSSTLALLPEPANLRRKAEAEAAGEAAGQQLGSSSSGRAQPGRGKVEGLGMRMACVQCPGN